MATEKRCPDFAATLRESSPNEDIYEQVARCFGEEIRRQARRRCRDLDLAEDAAQESMLSVMQALDTYRGDAPLERWLSRVVVSSCSRLRRGKKNDPRLHRSLDELPGEPRAADASQRSQEAALLFGEQVRLLEQAIGELDPQNQELLLLHEGDDVSLAELAARFELTTDAVKGRLKRSRAQLRARLIELADGPAAP
jgi:RNA polymerase sigma-70 factor (ECF subfamily)